MSLEKVLIFGGTRYFGKRIVEDQLSKGRSVTIATTGKTPDPFGSTVDRVTIDRKDRAQMLKNFYGTKWDYIFDQICFKPDEAQLLLEVFSSNVRKIIFTSTEAVYDCKPNLREEDFNPLTYTVNPQAEMNYQEGKRQCEKVFLSQNIVPVCVVRIPVVLGEDDYTQRLAWHIKRVHEGSPIFVPSLKSRIGFISADDAGDFISKIADKSILGPINASSAPVSFEYFFTKIEDVVGKKAVVSKTETPESKSPYMEPTEMFMVTERAQKAGFNFIAMEKFLPEVIAANLSTALNK